MKHPKVFATLLLTASLSIHLYADLAISSIVTAAAGIATWLGTPSSANLLAATTDETGTGALTFATAPTFTTSVTVPLAIFNASGLIRTNSADTADSLNFELTAGGASGTARSGSVFVYGNQAGGNAGSVVASLGDAGEAAASEFRVQSGGSTQVSINNAGDMTMNSNPATGAGDVFLCISSSNIVRQGATCVASAARFKTNMSGLDIAMARTRVMALQPSTFTWRNGNTNDIGLIADQVAAVDARLGLFHNGNQPCYVAAPNCEIFSVNDRAIMALLIRVVQDQQAHIEALEKRP